MKSTLSAIWWYLLYKLAGTINYIPFLLAITLLAGSALFVGHYIAMNRHAAAVVKLQFIDIHTGARIYYINIDRDEYFCTKYIGSNNGPKE